MTLSRQRRPWSLHRVCKTLCARVQVSSGASHDLQEATRIARHVVTQCGFSDAIGPVHVGEKASADLQRRVDGEMGRLLREAHARVTALLARPRLGLEGVGSTAGRRARSGLRRRAGGEVWRLLRRHTCA
jgi:hypothetical protein